MRSKPPTRTDRANHAHISHSEKLATMLLRLAPILLALALLLTGCEKSKVTAENFDKVKDGMTLTEVQSLLGKTYSDETASALRKVTNTGISASQTKPETTYVWKSKDIQIIVVFVDGRVVEHRKVDI